jgi:predicted PurR-regulated permease PerM
MSEERLFAVPPDQDEANPADIAAKRGEIPLPSDIRSFMLTGIFTLLVFYTLYFAREVFLPIMFAVLLKLLLMPPMRAFAKLRVPKVIAALLCIASVFGTLAILGYTLAGPAAGWLSKAPQNFAQLEERIHILKKPVEEMQKATEQVEKITEGQHNGATPVTVKGPRLADYVVSSTKALFEGMVTTVILLFFLLISGDLFLRRLVEILPTMTDKRQAVEISHEIERNISGYLFTITAMNVLVGAGTGLAMRLCGLADPVLWGCVAFLLNYVPILGPLCGVGLFFLIGLITFDTVWQALIPAAAYLGIHMIEGEFVTPMILARRFTLNPVLVIMSLVFWNWLWGIPGALLAVPLLAGFKIICDRVRPLMALGHFLGG